MACHISCHVTFNCMSHLIACHISFHATFHSRSHFTPCHISLHYLSMTIQTVKSATHTRSACVRIERQILFSTPPTYPPPPSPWELVSPVLKVSLRGGPIIPQSMACYSNSRSAYQTPWPNDSQKRIFLCHFTFQVQVWPVLPMTSFSTYQAGISLVYVVCEAGNRTESTFWMPRVSFWCFMFACKIESVSTDFITSQITIA